MVSLIHQVAQIFQSEMLPMVASLGNCKQVQVRTAINAEYHKTVYKLKTNLVVKCICLFKKGSYLCLAEYLP